MAALVDELNQLERTALGEMPQTPDEVTLEEWRVKYLGRKGSLGTLLGMLWASSRTA